MESLGTEIGQKMRCAVKAKLIEIGSGSGSTGYIDDELPDYVMIMVANKRSKKQMSDDLQLFLNENTDSFVNWLHQVLEKLQAVTLPPAITQKVSGKGSTGVSGKEKEKKAKKQKRSQKDQLTPPAKSSDTSSGRQKDVSSSSQPASITDVFADQLIGKAKRSLEIESQAPVKKQDAARKEVTPATSDDGFNIPSVTDLVKNAVVSSKRKEIEELAAIQKQIDEAKRQLKIIPDPEEKKAPEQDEDDDFLNLNAEDEDNDSQQQQSLQRKDSGKGRNSAPSSRRSSSNSPVTEENSNQRRARSPIVFDRHHQHHHHHHRRHHSDDEEQKTEDVAKLSQKSARERLGGKVENIISLSTHRMLERELYTPVHRRSGGGQAEKPQASRSDVVDRETRPRRRLSESRDRRNSGGGGGADRSHQQHRRSPVRRERSPPRRPRERLPPPATVAAIAGHASRANNRTELVQRVVMEQQPQIVKPERVNVRQRIGSRVIVAPPKPEFVEEAIDVPVNSVVTIKPRPVVAKNRQANKNLLLRAVAEAQKSMVGTVVKHQQQQHQQQQHNLQQTVTIGGVGESIKSRLGKRQINAIVSSLDAVVKRQKTKEKIIIEIGPNEDDDDETTDEEDADDDDDEIGSEVAMVTQRAKAAQQEEYVPKPVNDVSMRAKEATLMIESRELDLPNIHKVGAATDSNTQFVVTLDGAFKSGAVRKRVDVTEKRRDVVEQQQQQQQQQQKNAATVGTGTVEGNIRSRLSTRSAVAAAAAAAASATTTAKKLENNEPRPPKPLVDLRQRVEEKRKGSPAKNVTSAVVGGRGEGSPPATRKRRSPISFRENGREKASKEEEVVVVAVAEKEGGRKSANENSEAPQRKRVRISSSPKREEEQRREESHNREAREGNAAAANGKSAKVVTREKRDPKKYDNIPPLLSSVAIPVAGSTIGKVLERCKFYPNCTKGEACEFVHPSTNCKTFPNCNFGEACLYLHPKCKFDLVCVRPNCNYSHTPVSTNAPPLSSHVVPVQNYKSISSNPLTPPLCRFYPNCTNHLCTFFHPKLCYFGKMCPNKLECNFYHPETQAADKFKWVSPMTTG